MATPTLKHFINQTLQDVCDAIDDVRRERAAKPNKTPLFGTKDALPSIDFDLAIAVDPNDEKTKIIVLGAMSSDHPNIPLVAAPGPSRIKFRVSLSPEAEPAKREYKRFDNNDDDRPARRGGGDFRGRSDRDGGGFKKRPFGGDEGRPPRRPFGGDEGRPPRRFD